MVEMNFMKFVYSMFNMKQVKGWRRVWLEGGFRGASKDFKLKDGIKGTAIINNGYISVLCLIDKAKSGCKTMLIVFGNSKNELESLFSEDDAKEILEIYCSIN